VIVCVCVCVWMDGCCVYYVMSINSLKENKAKKVIFT
jgi:hypothetical protein